MELEKSIMAQNEQYKFVVHFLYIVAILLPDDELYSFI